MKKKLLHVLIFICTLFITTNVNAEALPCTWEKDFAGKTGITVTDFHQASIITQVKIGEKVNIAFTATGKVDSDTEYRVYLQSTTDENDRISVPLKGISSAAGAGNSGVRTGYYVVPEEAKIGTEYKYLSFAMLVKDPDSKEEYTTPNGTKVTSYDLFCGRFVFNEEDLEYHQAWNASLLKSALSDGVKSITVIGKKDPAVPANDILKSISLENSDIFVEGRMKFNISVSEPVGHVSMSFLDSAGNIFSTVLMGDHSNKTDFTAEGMAPGLTKNLVLGKYELYSVTLYDQNGNMLHYSKGYTEKSSNLEWNAYYFPLTKNLSFNLKKSDYIVGNENILSIFKLVLPTETVSIGSTIPITFEYSGLNKMTLRSIHINFTDSDAKKMFSSYLKLSSKGTYFSVPSTAKEGTYKIDSIVFTVVKSDDKVETIVIKNTIENERYKDIFAQSLKVSKSNNKNVLYFATEDLDEIAYETIENSQTNSIVIIDADYQTVIPSKLFDTIKETTRQIIINYQENEWIINGIDVENSKNTDVSMKFYNLEESNVSSTLKTVIGDKALVVEFPENGKLSGNTLIRLKDTEVFDKLESDKYYIYYVDENNNKLNKVAMEVQKSYDGYIEFYINHNSKYVISSKEVTNKDVLGEDDEVLTNNTNLKEKDESSNNKTNDILFYSLIGIGIIIIILLIIIIIKLSKKVSNKTTNIVNKEVESNNEE